LAIFGEVYATGALAFPPGARVLEIGCAEADWMSAMLFERPDLQITGIDWRPCTRPGLAIRGDVLTVDFPEGWFDSVVCVSSIEHIGLGHYDHDPVDPDGDIRCRERLTKWLKPGGWFYADVPYAETYHVDGTAHREYDDAALQERLIGPVLQPEGRWYGNWQGHLVESPNFSDPNLMNYVALLARKG
jgi:SAM-dependent methyltransferase